MRISFFILFLFFGLSSFAQQEMTGAEIVVFKKNIVNATKELRSFTADFVQKRQIKALKNPVESTGKIFVKMPDKIRIENHGADASIVVFNGNKLFLTSKSGTKTIDLQKNKDFKQLNDLILGSYNGSFLNGKDFGVMYLTHKNSKIVRLTPKSKEMQQRFSQIELTYRDNDNIVSEVKMRERNGDYLMMTFKNKKENTSLDDTLFVKNNKK